MPSRNRGRVTRAAPPIQAIGHQAHARRSMSVGDASLARRRARQPARQGRYFRGARLRVRTIAATRSRVSGTAIATATKAALTSHSPGRARTLVTPRRDESSMIDESIAGGIWCH